VLGKYHPHGDIAVYDALVRMAQDFACVTRWWTARATSARWTATRGRHALHRGAHGAPRDRAARDIDKETVDFGPNFDESEHEPLVLPEPRAQPADQRLGGIAVGMATNIPPHNLGEIVDATIRLIKNPEHHHRPAHGGRSGDGRLGVKGPDFPTAGFIYGRAGIRCRRIARAAAAWSCARAPPSSPCPARATAR
jgi:DNA gyrase subunit A